MFYASREVEEEAGEEKEEEEEVVESNFDHLHFPREYNQIYFILQQAGLSARERESESERNFRRSNHERSIHFLSVSLIVFCLNVCFADFLC